MEVSYPFGYGLSYTHFEYGDMEVVAENDTIDISLTVKNIGAAPGKEVVQVYTEKINSSIDRPIQELKGFVKTSLLKSEAVDSISIKIPVKELSYWNEKTNSWQLESGEYHIKVGASSRDIRLLRELYLTR